MALLVLAVVLAALVAGVAALTSALGVRLRSVGTIAGAVVAGLVGLLVLSSVVGIAVRGGDDTHLDDPDPAERAETQPAASAPEPEQADQAEPALRRPDIELGFRSDGIPAPPPVLDGLRDGDAPLVVVRGLLANAWGSVRQCTDDRRTCAPGIPVRTDDGGEAIVVVPVADAVGGTSCAPRCVLVFHVDEVGPTVELLFGATAPPPPSVRIQPAAARPGDIVEVTVAGLEPMAEASITQCALAVDPSHSCGGRATVVPVVADRDGTATVDYEVVAGDLGAPGGASCRRGEWCGITVVDGTTVLAEPAELRFLGSAGVEHDDTRLAVGLTAAVLLAALATWLARTTDWSAQGLPSTTDDAPDPV